jgi:hypothetical protein
MHNTRGKTSRERSKRLRSASGSAAETSGTATASTTRPRSDSSHSDSSAGSSSTASATQWLDEPFAVVNKAEFHNKIKVNGFTYAVGDVVSVLTEVVGDSQVFSPAVVEALFQEGDEMLVEARWFVQARDVPLKSAGPDVHEREVYETDEVGEFEVDCLNGGSPLQRGPAATDSRVGRVGARRRGGVVAGPRQPSRGRVPVYAKPAGPPRS